MALAETYLPSSITSATPEELQHALHSYEAALATAAGLHAILIQSARAEILRHVGDPQLAIDAMTDLIRLQPTEGGNFSSRAALYRQKMASVSNDSVEFATLAQSACSDLTRALELGPLNKDALKSRAFVLYKMNRRSESDQDLERLRSLEKSPTEGGLAVGECRREMGDYSGAVTEFNQVIELCCKQMPKPRALNPLIYRHMHALTSKAEVKLLLQDWSGAIAAIDDFMDLIARANADKSSPLKMAFQGDINFIRGKAFVELGDFEKAEVDLREAEKYFARPNSKSEKSAKAEFDRYYQRMRLGLEERRAQKEKKLE